MPAWKRFGVQANTPLARVERRAGRQIGGREGDRSRRRDRKALTTSSNGCPSAACRSPIGSKIGAAFAVRTRIAKVSASWPMGPARPLPSSCTEKVSDVGADVGGRRRPGKHGGAVRRPGGEAGSRQQRIDGEGQRVLIQVGGPHRERDRLPTTRDLVADDLAGTGGSAGDSDETTKVRESASRACGPSTSPSSVAVTVTAKSPRSPIARGQTEERRRRRRCR